MIECFGNRHRSGARARGDGGDGCVEVLAREVLNDGGELFVLGGLIVDLAGDAQEPAGIELVDGDFDVVLIVEDGFEVLRRLGEAGDGFGELDGGHRTEHGAIGGRERFDVPRIAEELVRPARELAVVMADGVPVELVHPFDGCGDGEPCGDIARALPVELVEEALVDEVTEGGRVEIALAIGAGVEKGRALRRAAPLVEIAGVPVAVEGGDIEIEHAGRVGAIDEEGQILCAAPGSEILDGVDEGGGRGDVIDENESSARGAGVLDGAEDVGRRMHGQRDVDFADGVASAAGEVVHRAPNGVVDMVGRDDLITRRQVERTEGRIDAGGGVGDKGKVIARQAEERGDRGACIGEVAFKGAVEKLDGPRFHALPPMTLHRENFTGAGTERAVIQKDDRVIEQPMGAEIRPDRRGWLLIAGHHGHEASVSGRSAGCTSG